MKKGFTLLELIIVIIIIGILATLGFTQYQRVVEKGRTSEARTTLGQIRTAETAYYYEYGCYTETMDNLSVNATGACVNTHYFRYSLSGINNNTGVATASRCVEGEGGKNPGIGTSYDMSLGYENGTFVGGY